MNRTPAQIIETLAAIGENHGEDILTADGFDEALLGYAEGWFPYDGGPGRGGAARGVVAMYDVNKCIDILMERDGMDAWEASEFFSTNLLDAYVGGKSPVFVTFLRER